MSRYKIGVIPGDGIGPEVAAEGLKALEAAAGLDGFEYELVEYPYSGAHYLKTHELVPDVVIDEWRELDAVLLGAIGHPDVEPGLVERSVILGLRFGLDLYVNLRPIKLYSETLCPLKGKGPDDIDFVVVRENTEGMYSQIGGHLKKNTPDEVAIVNGVYTWKGCERACRYAFELARKRAAERTALGDKGRIACVTLVDKANAIRPHDLWQRAYEHVAADFPDVETDHAYVDACCMWMVKNPEWFDVIVTTNLFGDILSDLCAGLVGGLGLTPSGNIGTKTAIFEAVHGTAPDIAGKGLANPTAVILSAALLLDHIDKSDIADKIRAAVRTALADENARTGDLGGSADTRVYTDRIISAL